MDKLVIIELVNKVDHFLNTECDTGFKTIKKVLFSRPVKPMFEAALGVKQTATELKLQRLALILKYMGDCVDTEQGKDNKILYLQFFRILDMNLKEVRVALQEFIDNNKELLTPPPKSPPRASPAPP